MKRRRLVVVTMAATWPPRRGNQIRTTELLSHLGEHWDVDSYSLTFQRTDLPLPRRTHRAGPRWVDHRTRDPIATAWMIGLGRLGKPPIHIEKLLPAWPHGEIRRALKSADVVWVAPPYHFDWVRRETPKDTPVVFDEHSIEADLYAATDSGFGRAIAREVEREERQALSAADLVFVTSPDDIEPSRAWGARRVELVPNGVDVERFRPVPDERKRELRRSLGLPIDEHVGVFVGSGHPPNVEAVEELEREAAVYRAGHVRVVVVGRCGLGRKRVDGVIHTGEVPDVAPYLQAADMALCPLRSGSGTSLKTVEYLASGLPLVSSEVGVRGLRLDPGVDVEIAPLGSFASSAVAIAGDPARREQLAAAARAAVAERYSWAAVGRTATAALDALVDGTPLPSEQSGEGAR